MAANIYDPRVIARVKITGSLCLQSPLLIGAGGDDAEEIDAVDRSTLKDKNGRPFIPGTSLAGVLRERLRQTEGEEVCALLFGEQKSSRQEGNDQQSAVNIFDVCLEKTVLTQRDGVGINFETGTAKNTAKYNYEAVERGAEGKLNILVTVRQYQQELCSQGMRRLLKAMTDSLAAGFSVGAMTTKGFGRVQVKDAQAVFYDFHQPEAVQAWLSGHPSQDIYVGNAQQVKPRLQDFQLAADFVIHHSLIVRDSDGQTAEELTQSVAAVMLQNQYGYIIPGTTIKGVLRHRARYILQSLGKEPDYLDALMGTDKGQKQQSRFQVDEVYLPKSGESGVVAQVQARNRIDRFTGGTMDTGLFSTKPVWQQDAAKPGFHLQLCIRDCQAWEAGLTLFLLRDLWLGRLAVGGEKAIGRGVLSGCHAVIQYQGETFVFDPNGVVTKGNADQLEKYAQAVAALGD